jgi:hypothetical protein
MTHPQKKSYVPFLREVCLLSKFGLVRICCCHALVLDKTFSDEF